MSGLATAFLDMHRAIRRQLLTVDAIPSDRHAYMGRSMWEPSAEPWLRETFAPGSGENAGAGLPRLTRFSGLYFLDIFCPAGWDEVQIAEKVGPYVEAFASGTAVNRNGVTVHFTGIAGARPLAEADWIQTPLTIEWWADILHS